MAYDFKIKVTDKADNDLEEIFKYLTDNDATADSINELFLKITPTSDRLLAGSELRYPYEGSKTLMHVFDRFEDTELIAELLKGMYAQLPEKKRK